MFRNQIARNVDVMLEQNPGLGGGLSNRDPENSLFLLLTPRRFKKPWGRSESRLYAYKYYEYKRNPESLAEDLRHRKGADWERIANRIGWLTWEDFRDVCEDCCPWLA